ncbi:sensor histidine kinase [Paenibacillus aurantius]|uniref:Sensor histidine kinase n=1 Tax=Paenibacillus aurantius TaxID=2918900 RepID=A0AA96LGL1_9BACL|nr:sensor histidine kinase [Paenibacillus aurantius]WNQ12900.1 sensor histidine kinase [Paenibacillus aurantius]
MMRRLYRVYNDLNMRYKLFIQYLLLLAVPFTLFIAVNYRITSKDMEEQARYSSRQAFEQSRSFMEYKLYIVKTYLNVLSTNGKMQEILHRTPDYYYNNLGLWSFDIDDIRKQFYLTRPSNDIMKTSLYTQKAITYNNETGDVLRTDKIIHTSWYQNLMKSSYTFEMFPNQIPGAGKEEESTRTITVVRSVSDVDSLQEIIGILRVDIPEMTFSTILDRVAFTKQSSVFLINESGEIMSQSSKADPSRISFSSDVLKANTADELKKGIWGRRTIGSTDYLVGVQSVNESDWYLISLIPYQEILGSQYKVMKQMLLIALLIALFLLPLAFFAASSGTRRIRSLISQMKSVKQGNFNVWILHESKDEIGELSRNFKSMISKVGELLEEKYALGQEVKSMELKALQAQINPHFLYNTLDLIYWKAMRIHEHGIYELVQSLSRFYKLSLSKGEDIVTLRNEIEHIKAYIDIQNARFKNGIRLELDIPEVLYDRKMPKITLQPLIENSIIHGILETESETGTIAIKGFLEDGKFMLEVRDDGVGLSDEKVNAILKQSTNDPFHGYGANNINKRIKLLYGYDYGLSYRKNDGPGVTAIISLPEVTE